MAYASTGARRGLRLLLAPRRRCLLPSNNDPPPLSPSPPVVLCGCLVVAARRQRIRRRHGTSSSSSSAACSASFRFLSSSPSPSRSEGGEGEGERAEVAVSTPPSHPPAPDLSDLLKTDIFARSWAEPDAATTTSTSSSSPPPRRNGSAVGGGVDNARRVGYRRRDEPSDSSPSGETAPSTTTTSTPRWREQRDDGSPPSSVGAPGDIPGSRRRPRSPAEAEYDDALGSTDRLLDSLLRLAADDGDGGPTSPSTTLQLADFDGVMARWSRLHALVAVDDDGTRGSSSLLKRGAYDQCARLLRALEDNHDRLLDGHATVADSVGGGRPRTTTTTTTHYSRLIPNAASYNMALHALANTDGGGRDAAHDARSIVMRMLDRCRRYEDAIVGGFENGWEGTESPAARPPLPPPPPPPEPTAITMNSAMHAIARSGAADAGHLAEEVYRAMDGWRVECDKPDNDGGPSSRFYRGVRPNTRTLACVMDAWANSNAGTARLAAPFAPERADAILRLAVERRRAYVDRATGRTPRECGGVEPPPDERDECDAFADGGDIVEEETIQEELRPMGMASSSSSSSQLGEIPISQPIETREPPLRPNTVAFNTCIHAWAACDRGREGALRAQELLFDLEALSDSGELDLPREDTREITTDDDDAQTAGLTPNARTYSMVMNAWANVANVEGGSGEDAASRCEDILNKMEGRGAADKSVRPNLVAYVTSISAWARTRNVAYAASRAENILNRMIDLYYSEDKSELPLLDGDVEFASHDAPFNSVITCYARSSDPYATERALAVLERLIASPINPTVTTFNAVMDVCAKHGDPVSALEVFDKMKNMNIRGDSTSVDTILNAFGRCETAGSAERAYDFLRKLEQSSEEYNFTPSAVSYSSVINAFARASGKDYGGLPAVKRAKEIYDSLIDQMKNGAIYGAADPFANSCLLNCCANIYGSRAEKKEALVTAVSVMSICQFHSCIFHSY